MLCVPMPILGLYSYVEIWAISTVDEYNGRKFKLQYKYLYTCYVGK